MTPSTALQVGATAVAIGLIGALAGGYLVPAGDGYAPAGTADPGRTYAEHGVAPAGSQCLLTVVRGPSQAWTLLGLADDGTGYAVVRICAVPDADTAPDAGLEAVPALPPGFDAMAESQLVVPFTLGMPAFAAWSASRADAPHACACSTGADCSVAGKAAPLGRFLEAGTWAGEGCRAKTCMEWTGVTSWPAECP